MLSFNTAYYHLLDILKPIYDTGEATIIAHEVMEHITGLGKLQRLDKKDELLTETQQAALEAAIKDLQRSRPLQYITETAWFMGKAFKVNEHVLIPRPETEELVQWIVDDHKNQSPSILDIGTGSGCIPVSLKLALANASVTACDISNDALNVARENARILNADVNFVQTDFLEEANWQALGTYDVIVSNPPYIPVSEISNMHTNVTDHEPHLALFVPNDDALLFYRKIARFGHTHLQPAGTIYCELHKDHAVQTKDLFEQMGYGNVQMVQDMHGNDRMLKAIK